MKVAKIDLPASLENLRIVEQPEPGIRPGMVKVRWHALSLNFHDYIIVTGMLPTADGRIPVSDGAGEVIEVGAGVNSWKPGDRVISTFFPDWIDGPPHAANTARLSGDSIDGCAAEVTLVEERWITPMPRGYSYAQAATLPCAALTAWRALVDTAAIRRAQSVLVQGSGGVSVFALQFAKALGATVFAMSSTEDKCARLRRMGADHVLNYRQTPQWGEHVAERSGGGVDVVIDVGGTTTLEQSLDATRVGGSIVSVGLLGGLVASLPLPKLLLKQQRLLPITVGSHEHQQRMVELIESSGLRPVIDTSFPLAALTEALRYQAAGRHFGKIVIDIGDAAHTIPHPAA